MYNYSKRYGKHFIRKAKIDCIKCFCGSTGKIACLEIQTRTKTHYSFNEISSHYSSFLYELTESEIEKLNKHREIMK